MTGKTGRPAINTDSIPALGPHELFLNHAAISPVAPRTARQSAAALEKLSRGAPDVRTWVGELETARRLCAHLLNCSSDTIGFMQNTSQAISVVAEGIGLGRGDEVLVPTVEYPANVYPWLNLQKRGVSVRFIEIPQGAPLSPQRILSEISPKTKLIAFSHIQYYSGVKTAPREICSYCRKKGIYTLVDIIQSAGVCPTDVTAWDVDFAAFGSQKWLMAPPGIGVLYMHPDRIGELRPPLTGAFSVETPFDTTHFDLTFPQKAKRIESGTMNFMLFPAFNEALRIVIEKGVSTIAEEAAQRRTFLTELLKQKGHSLIGPDTPNAEAGPIVTFTPCHTGARQLYSTLARAHISCTLRSDTVRFAPHYYTEMSKLRRLEELL
ncbi:MAG: aminotransferase class V-fold PLP-dependent enzyme [Fibrobacterota bacterium]